MNTATLAPLRRRWSRRRALRKQTKAQLAAEAHVYKRNPKLVYKRAEAKRRAMEKWQKKRRRR